MKRVFEDLERPQRQDETIDLDRLMPWINKYVKEAHGVPAITQFSGGASNWTYRLHFKNKDLILRRAPSGKKAAGAHNMPREYYLQQKLKPHFSYVPEMIALCEDESVLGSAFYLMERLEGIILRKNIPSNLEWDKDTIRNICTSFWDKLIELHQVDYQQEGLDQIGKGEGYIERQVIGWSKRYQDAKTWNVPAGSKVIHWLENQMPAQERLCVIHNDYRLDNVVLDVENPANILGVLDWELAAIGDPLMDLGSSLAYWIQADDNFFIKSIRRQPTHTSGMMNREEIIGYYARQTGSSIDDFRFYRVYGLFRLAGIVQQIYYRYSKGFSKNKSFKNFWLISYYLIKTCERIIASKK